MTSATPRRAALAWPRLLRQAHLYAGALFAPAILFFAFSGALQEFGLHEARAGAAYQPPVWVMRLAAVHKHQTLALPVKRTLAAAGKPKHAHDSQAASAVAEPDRRAPPPPGPRTVLLRVFFCAASIGLVGSSLTGLYLAFAFSRRPRLVLALVVLGAAAPVALLLG
jgi:hypothetical protein